MESIIFVLAMSLSFTLAFLVMFSPALVELKKPQDQGPRQIIDRFTQSLLSKLNLPLKNLEDDAHRSELLSVRLLSLLDFHNLEGSI